MIEYTRCNWQVCIRCTGCGDVAEVAKCVVALFRERRLVDRVSYQSSVQHRRRVLSRLTTVAQTLHVRV